MTDDARREVLLDTAVDILENAAFVFGEPVDDKNEVSGMQIEFSITFAGPDKGTLVFSSSRSFAAVVASNLMGLDDVPEEEESVVADALGELGNIITGAVLERWFGGEETCEIGTPTCAVLSDEQSEDEGEAASIWIGFVSDEGDPLQIKAYFDGNA